MQVDEVGEVKVWKKFPSCNATSHDEPSMLRLGSFGKGVHWSSLDNLT